MVVSVMCRTCIRYMFGYMFGYSYRFCNWSSSRCLGNFHRLHTIAEVFCMNFTKLGYTYIQYRLNIMQGNASWTDTTQSPVAKCRVFCSVAWMRGVLVHCTVARVNDTGVLSAPTHVADSCNQTACNHSRPRHLCQDTSLSLLTVALWHTQALFMRIYNPNRLLLWLGCMRQLHVRVTMLKN